MKKYELPIEQQILILTEAKELITGNTAFSKGVCGSVYKTLCKHSIIDETTFKGNSNRYITGLNMTNAIRLSKKYHFTVPNGIHDGWWWYYTSDWTIIRHSFINALISELKLPLKK